MSTEALWQQKDDSDTSTYSFQAQCEDLPGRLDPLHGVYLSSQPVIYITSCLVLSSTISSKLDYYVSSQSEQLRGAGALWTGDEVVNLGLVTTIRCMLCVKGDSLLQVDYLPVLCSPEHRQEYEGGPSIFGMPPCRTRKYG